MDLTITGGSVAAMDAIPATGTPQYNTNGTPPGIPASIGAAYQFDSIIVEIRNVIVGAGITPNRFVLNQLYLAIVDIASGAIGGLGTAAFKATTDNSKPDVMALNTFTTNNLVKFDANGSGEDSGVPVSAVNDLGTAAYKAASNNSDSNVASVDSAATGNIPVFTDNNGSLGNSATALANLALISMLPTVQQSGPQVFADGGNVVFAHTIGATPDVVVIELICQVANAGYNPGDTFEVNNGNIAWGDSAFHGVRVQKSAAQVIVGFSAGRQSIMDPANDESVLNLLTAADWKVNIRAIKYNH